MKHQAFTKEEEQAAILAIIAERDDLLAQVAALQDELAAVRYAARMPEGY